jgi:lipopolysaccharide export system protein LptA
VVLCGFFLGKKPLYGSGFDLNELENRGRNGKLSVRFTIERIRTLVLVAGVLLLAMLGVFLVRARLKNVLNRHDLPRKLAKGIVQEANGYTVVHAFGAHLQYRIHASREVELKSDFVELHDVQIDLFGADGSEIDRISGDTFQYDQKSGKAMAQGPVEMLLTRPSPSTEAAMETAGKTKGRVIAEVGASTGPAGQIDVKTSGVTFDRNSGLVTTTQRVDFSTQQGNGSATGASYDSQSGYLTLDQTVELTVHRGADNVQINAQHAELDRGAQTCTLMNADTKYRRGQVDAAEAKILFRADGSAERLDAKGGITVATANGGHLAAPVAWMDFDEDSEPRHGHMEGGVTMDSANGGRTIHGTSPTAELNFGAKGELKSAHLERGVEMRSDETDEESAGPGAGSGPLRLSRVWRSPLADIYFRVATGAGRGEAEKGQLEVESMRGSGGVTITTESRHGNAASTPTTMTADEVTGLFGAGSVLRAVNGVGHARIDETTAAGARQTATGDRLEAEFAEDRDHEPQGPRERGVPVGSKGARQQGSEGAVTGNGSGATGLQSAELDGNVVLFEQPAAKPGAQPPPPLRATAGKAVYEGKGEWLHLTMSPRVNDGALELTSDRVEMSRQSGDAWARGNVKATWANAGAQSGMKAGDAVQGGIALGGKGPAHVVAAEAQLNQPTGEATFRGHARLWQETNFVSGPVIVLDQHLQTLTARSSDPAEPVQVVMLSASAPGVDKGAARNPGAGRDSSRSSPAASVIRVRGGDLRYSDAERRAVMRGGALSAVIAETGTATSSSDAVELLLMPAANRDGSSGAQAQSGGAMAQVDRMKATGHVVLTIEGRRGTGEQLVYTGATGEYVLTGSAGAPPKMSDPERGTVTGEALIFDSRDDRVRIEGGGRETETETTAPEAHGKSAQLH